MSQYMVAIKREQRTEATEDWFMPALTVEKLRILSPIQGTRIIVEGDEEAISRLRDLLSPLCHIEKVIVHQTRVVAYPDVR